MLGDLQRNVTDFTLLATGYELISPKFDYVPATYDFILREDSSHFISSPLTNVTISVKGLHETFYVVESDFQTMLHIIFVFAILLLYRISRYQKRIRTTYEETNCV